MLFDDDNEGLVACVFSGQYLNLDKDHNGMLSKEELSRYGTGTLTGVFLDRVYQECLTYDGEMVNKTHQSLISYTSDITVFVFLLIVICLVLLYKTHSLIYCVSPFLHSGLNKTLEPCW